MKIYRTELDLNNKQRTACLNHAGAARFAWNWGLNQKIRARQNGEKTPTAIDLHRRLVMLKKTEMPWLYDVSKWAPQEALRNLDKAFDNFFRRCKRNEPKKGFPKYKSRKKSTAKFTLGHTIKVSNKTIRLPRLGILRLKEHGYIPTNARILSATIKERAGRWFISVNIDEKPIRQVGTEIIGVDVGIKNIAVLSDGTRYENPKALEAATKRLRLLDKAVSRKKKGSNNRTKAVKRLARQHYRIACIRKDAIHKATDAITKRAAVLGIETLNVAGMLKNHCLAKALSDASMSEFHKQLEYKMKWAGGIVVKADMFYPSSKICSVCGVVKDKLTLKERTFKCDDCGNAMDRDLNAAINLKNMAVSSTVTACGEERFIPQGSCSSVNQEPNTMREYPNG